MNQYLVSRVTDWNFTKKACLNLLGRIPSQKKLFEIGIIRLRQLQKGVIE